MCPKLINAEFILPRRRMGLCWSLAVELRVLFSSRNCHCHLCSFKQDFVKSEKKNRIYFFFKVIATSVWMGRSNPRLHHFRHLVNGQEFPFCLSKSIHLHFMVADLPDHHGLAVLSLTLPLKPLFCFGFFFCFYFIEKNPNSGTYKEVSFNYYGWGLIKKKKYLVPLPWESTAFFKRWVKK